MQLVVGGSQKKRRRTEYLGGNPENLGEKRAKRKEEKHQNLREKIQGVIRPEWQFRLKERKKIGESPIGEDFGRCWKGVREEV